MDFIGGFGYAAILVGVIAGLAIVAFIIFGLPLLDKIGERTTSGLYTGSDDSSQIVPEYSIAEARANEGKYHEAVDEYRKVIEKHPEDVYPHLRIAELALDHLKDHGLVEAELLAALEKAKGETSVALAAGRLADFYQLTLNDPARALEVMRQVREKIPGTKRASLAEERIAVLERVVQTGVLPPTTPDKIAARPSRYKMTE
jgi:tetratricopeptide (TPR) repeat protein